ncbi:MAG: hypothetical protein M3422_24295, partial [Actinomycetota bacterium]|nr:hypothetical protein [Actinomycetota bacterium]
MQGEAPAPARKLDLAMVAELVLSAAAPITVVTALLVHVGWVRNRSYYGYFGIDQDLLRPSVQD